MAIEGPLRELALSDILQLLALSQKTGELTVLRDGESEGVAVYLEKGAVTGVRAAGQTRNLGELLLLAGKLTERQLESAIQEQLRRDGELLGSILVESFGVSADDVRRQLRFQVEELVFDLSRRVDGYFRFEERPPLDRGPITIRLATESLLMETARQVDELAAIRHLHPHGDPVPVLNEQPASGDPLNLQPLEWEVLAAVDGQSDVRALARELGRAELDVAKAVFSLVSAGVVVLGKHPDLPAGGEPSVQERFAEVERAMEAGELDAAERLLNPFLENGAAGQALLLAGRIAAARGDQAGALERLEEAVERDPLLAPAHCALGIAAIRAGRLERGEQALLTCLRLPELSVDEREELSRLARAVQELRTALERVER